MKNWMHLYCGDNAQASSRDRGKTVTSGSFPAPPVDIGAFFRASRLKGAVTAANKARSSCWLLPILEALQAGCAGSKACAVYSNGNGRANLQPQFEADNH
jgi:hypothetical protein